MCDIAQSESSAQELAREPNFKIERAKHHVADLRHKIDAFLSEHPFKLIAHAKRKAGRMEFFTETEKPIPVELSLIVGDAIHNLAASLDLAMYQISHKRAKSEWEIAFPFPRKPEGLDGAINKGQVIFAGNKVVDAIKHLKPYPGGHPILNGLHVLDARDKHRLLILSDYTPILTTDQFTQLTKKLVGIKLIGGGTINFMGPKDRPIMNLGVRFATRHMADSKQEAAVQPTFNIAFGDGQPFQTLPVLSKLDEMIDTVQQVVRDLIAAYLSPDNTFPA